MTTCMAELLLGLAGLLRLAGFRGLACLPGLAGRTGAEPAAVLGRADADGLDERAAHGLGGAVAAGAGGLLDAFGGVLQVPAGRFKAGAADVTAGGHADLSGERAGEVPW